MMDASPSQDASRFRPAEGAALAMWFGLLTGLGELALLSVKKFYLGHLVRMDADYVWMSPLASVALCGIPAAGAALAAIRRGSGARIFGALVAVLVFLAAFNLLLPYRALHLYAKAVIAAGLGVQAARVLTRHRAGFQRMVGRTLPWIAGVAVVLAAGTYGARWLRYERAVTSLPPGGSGRPNVVLVVLDTVRARSLSLYGYERPTTPNLERWAKSAVVFERAIAPSPWTFPSHASMFTGRWPHELSANWRTPLDNRYPALAEVVRDRGYLTAGFAANIFYCTTEFGMARGFLHYEDYPVSPSQLLVSSSIGRELFSFSLNEDFAFQVRNWVGYEEIPGRRRAGEINDAFLSWLDRQDAGRPFFAFLNYLDAHQPFLPPAPFDTKFRGDAPRGDPRHWWSRQWSAAELQAEKDAYDGAIAYLDEQLGRLADELRRRGKLDNTVVIVTSDHGEHLGEHGFMRHGNTLYAEVLHVPLVILFPGRVTSAVAVREPVTLRDLPVTVMELLGLHCDGCFPGRSWTTHWEPGGGGHAGASPSDIFSEVSQGLRVPDRYPNAKGDMQSLIVGNLHYIVRADGVEELYDLATDAREQHNLVGSEAVAAALGRMRTTVAGLAGRASPAPAVAAEVTGRR